MGQHREIRHIVGGFGLSPYSEPDLEFDRGVVELWHSAVPAIQTPAFVHEGTTVTLNVDWSNVQRLVRGQLKTGSRTGKRLKVPVEIVADKSNEFSALGWYWNFFVESYLYDLFIVMNLALPGSADFMNL